MQRLSHWTETVLSNKIAGNNTVLSLRQSQKTIRTVNYRLPMLRLSA